MTFSGKQWSNPSDPRSPGRLQLTCVLGLGLGLGFIIGVPADVRAVSPWMGAESTSGSTTPPVVGGDRLLASSGLPTRLRTESRFPLLKQSQATPPAPPLDEVLSHEFISDAAGFSIRMPSPPVQEPLPTDEALEDGQVFVQIRVEENEQLVFYMVGYADYIGEISSQEEIDQVLTGFVEGFAGGDQIRERREVSLNGYRGLEVEVSAPDSLNIVRGYVVQQRLYFTGVFASPFAFFGPVAGGSTEITRPPTTAAFFESFQLLNAPPPQ